MLHWLKRAASGIANASPGKVRLFVDAADGTYKQKDENGVVKVLGNGIKSIALQSTVGLTKTYRITRDDDSTFDFAVTDGRAIVSITAPATPGVAGALDTYTINYNDGSTSTFVVRNGTNGLNGSGQPAANAPTTIQPDATGAIGTRTAFYALEDHRHAIDAATAVGLNGGSASGEGTSTSFARADHTHAIANGGTPASVGAANAQGASTSLARADHVHAHGDQLGGSLHALATAVAAGFMSAADKVRSNSLASFFFFATDYGPLVDGSDTATVAAGQATANRTTIQAAIDACEAAGGGVVVLPPGTFHIDATLTMNVSCVILMGAGAFGNTDASGVPQTGPGTSLFWNNTASPSTTAMIDCVSVQGAGNAAVKRLGVKGLTLQCAGNVGIGLRVKSIHFGAFSDIYIINPSSRGVSTECFLTGTELGEAADVTKCTFDNIGVRLLEAPASAVGFFFDGATNANTSNSTFRNLACSCQGTQLAMDIRNTDSNSFYDVRINQSNGATVQPVRIRGGASVGLEARGNVFFYLAAGGSSTGLRGVYSEGTETGGVNAPAKNNSIYGYSIENGEPYPVIGTGSTLRYEIVGGTQPFKLNSALLSDVAFTNTAATVASLTIPANALVPGTTFEFTAAGSVINTTTASNLVCDIMINGVAVATATLALGTTAAAAPGRGFWYEGSVTFRSSGAAASVASTGRIEVAALSISSNQTAPTTVNTTAAVTLAIRIASSAASSTGTIRQATIIQGN